jgi:hypothetical protein
MPLILQLKIIKHLLVAYMEEKYKSLQVKREESLISIEEKYTDLLKGKQYKLRLPSTLNSAGALGLEVAVIQLIGTWLRTGEYKKIFHSHQNPTAEAFEKICSSMYGLITLVLVDEVTSRSGDKIPRGMALQGAKKTIDNLRSGNYKNCFKSRYFGVPCIKTPTYDKEFQEPFYNGDHVISSEAFFRQIHKILKSKIGEKGRVSTLESMIDFRDLSVLLWELFKNTHDHGREDISGNLIESNFRGILIQQNDLTKDYFNIWCGELPSTAQQNLKLNWANQEQKNYVLDISIIDFGSGFFDLAKTKTGVEVDDEGKIATILKCFDEGWSRFPKSNRGSGLTKVLQCINKYHGWLRVRTDNLVIEKTFVEGDSAFITENDIRVLENKVVGTTIHISLRINPVKSSVSGASNV